MTLGPHADFIVGSYVITALVVAALVVWIVADYTAQRRVLSDLEQRGITRRSREKGDAP
jgi:heme exporter protein D